MLDLILTMIDALKKHEGYLNFNKSDIDKLIKKYKVSFDDLEDINELGYIVLWKNNYITNEKFAKLMDIEYKDSTFFLVTDDFNSVLSKKYDFEINVLDGVDDWWQSSDYYYDVDVRSYWNDYTESTLKRIIKFCIDKGLEIDGELMTDKNTKFINDDIYFNNNKLVDYINDSDLSDLKHSLNNSICEAQDSADQDEVYNEIKSAFVNKVGEFKFVSNENNNEKLYINLNNLDWNDVEQFLINDYGEYGFDENGIYGDLYYILKDMEYFDFRTPNYDYISGDIDKNVLNEYTQSRLDWD